jgi:hypothetical protein
LTREQLQDTYINEETVLPYYLKDKRP